MNEQEIHDRNMAKLDRYERAQVEKIKQELLAAREPEEKVRRCIELRA